MARQIAIRSIDDRAGFNSSDGFFEYPISENKEQRQPTDNVRRLHF